MTIKWDGFAVMPRYCGICGRRFWLEPYKIYRKVSLFCISEACQCKECVKKEEEDAGKI